MHFVPADLSKAHETYNLVRGHHVVIHCAALCEPWGPWQDFLQANVTATDHVVQACRAHDVRLLVHVSSPSICFGLHTGHCLDVREDEPLPGDDEQTSRYAVTKKMAEDVILRRAAQTASLTCILLRPRAIFGPGDTTLLPLLVDRLRSGKLPVIGNPKEAIGDFTYVDNVVYACLCCMAKYAIEPPAATTTTTRSTKPRIYNITNGEPMPVWDVIRILCQGLDLKYPTRQVSYRFAYTVGYICEAICTLALLFGINKRPLLTRHSVNVLARCNTLDISAAKQELGYRPIVSTREGLQRVIESFAAAAAPDASSSAVGGANRKDD